jgi:hypothetical protein
MMTVKENIKRKCDRHFWQQQVAAWQHSGLKPGVYAQQQLCIEQFKRWRYRLKREASVGNDSFIPVAIANVKPELSHTYTLSITGMNGVQVKLELPVEQAVSFTKELLCGR